MTPVTRLLYHEDTHRCEGVASLCGVRPSVEGEKGAYVVILDGTIFYPQGGGQPADTGMILPQDSNVMWRFNVEHVTFDAEGGIVKHHGSFINYDGNGEDLSHNLENVAVHMQIDGVKRLLHARIHSAGHLYDYLIQHLVPGIKAKSGYHFPAGPYVEYFIPEHFDSSPKAVQSLKSSLDESARRLEENGGIGIETSELSISAAEELLGSDMISDKARLASTIRLIRFQDSGVRGASACAGTHVYHSREIGKVIVRKLTTKAGILRLAYQVE